MPGGGIEGWIKEFGGRLAGIAGTVKDVLTSALSPVNLLFDVVGRALGDFLANMTPIIDLLASALMPILKALFPIFKMLAISATYLGQVIFTISGGIAKAVGWLIQAIGAQSRHCRSTAG